MPVVIAKDNVIDDVRVGRSPPVALHRLFRQFSQLGFNHRDVQLFARRRALQRLFAAAAVVHIILTEQRGGARNCQRQLA